MPQVNPDILRWARKTAGLTRAAAVKKLAIKDTKGAVAIDRLRRLVAELPETVVVAEADAYLHAECRSRRGFVDDIECRLDASGGLIHIRSAARIGLIQDMGVNRKPVETLRTLLAGGARESP